MTKPPPSSTKTLTAIAADHECDVGHLYRVWSGERRGSYPLYQALRKNKWSLGPEAIAHEAAARKTYDKERRK